MSNATIGGKSYDVSKDLAEKIQNLIEDGEAVEVESLGDLIGKKFAFQCARYIYFGKVLKVNEVFLELGDAATVFDTGAYDSSSASDMQTLPKGKLFLMRQSIEAIYPTKW